jgi:glutamyl-tRNA reductase
MNYKYTLDGIKPLVEEFKRDRQSDEAYKEQSIHELKNWFINFIKKKKQTSDQGSSESFKEQVKQEFLKRQNGKLT